MADVVVSFAVERIVPILLEKLREVERVKTDVENIRDELDRMIAFLKDADSAVDNSHAVKTNWVNQVRDVAHATEDVLDKFALGLKKNHQIQGSGRSNTVLYYFLNCIVNSRFISKIVSEIQSLNTRVISIAEGRQRYFDTAGSSNSNVSSCDLTDDIKGDALLEEEVNLVGIESPKRDLMRFLSEKGSRVSVISVVGPGGVGKSALVRKVYDDAEVKKQFKSHAWITIPWTDDINDILKDMIQQLFRETKESLPEGMDTMKNIQLKELIKVFLQEKRYVIVFDDVRRIDTWKAIKHVFPDSCDSRLILTTRNKDIARDVAIYSSVRNEKNVYDLKPLPREHSLTLFCRKTFRGNPCPPHLEEITTNILKRCAGLPIAIKSVGGILASKSRRLDEWEMVYKSLGAELERENESLIKILMLSFDDLPYHLKYCLLYMAMYPEYHLIKCNSLIRLWIMEDFVKEEKEGCTVEQVAQDYLKKLANKNLIEVVKTKENGNIKSFRINYFLRENLLKKAKPQNFLMTVGKNSNVQWNSKARRLSIDGLWENFNPEMSGKRLRSLLAFGVTDSSSILELLKSCTMLKVLDLSGLPLKSFPEVITKLLLLKYLSLRRTEIGSLPRSIKKLQELETLDLKHSFVTELPIEILQLRKLRHLIIRHRAADSDVHIKNFLGFKLTNGIGALKSLYQLSVVEATPGTIIEIGNLKELRRLFMFKLGREDGMMVCSSIEKLQNLQSLALFSKAENEILDVDHISSPPASLQKLSVSGRLEKFPYWIKSLENLVKVCFRWSRLRDDPLQYLQDLPSLVRLELVDGYVGEELCFRAGKFPSLKKLYLDTFEPLKHVVIEEGAMPNLKKIKIQWCKHLESVPSGIECLSKMQVLKLFHMSPQFIEKLTGEDSHKIAHIPKLRFRKNDVTELDED